jgi:HEAT repeat protein
VRQWVALEAASLLDEHAAPILLRLARDRHADVRMDAVNELVKLDREGARRLAPALRRRLRSDASTSRSLRCAR